MKQGMKTEVQQLERLKVGRCLVERDGRALAKEKQVTVLTSRWVLTQKTSEIARWSHCSARLRYGWGFSLELWNLRANVVFGRASLLCSQFPW